MQERVLIADDDKHTRELMEAFLANEGFSVRSFSNGYDLLAQVEKETPCLVILDVMMPGMDGLNTCAALRQRAPELPIIIVSAKDSPYDRVTGLTIGSDGNFGLGLPIAQNAARCMGGSLTVENIPGTGVRFTLRLPAAGGESA